MRFFFRRAIISAQCALFIIASSFCKVYLRMCRKPCENCLIQHRAVTQLYCNHGAGFYLRFRLDGLRDGIDVA